MKIFSFAPQAQPPVHKALNAAPVTQAVNPFAVLTGGGPRLQVLDRDAFVPAGSQIERKSPQKPVVSSFLACQEWISKHGEEQLKSRLEGYLSGGSFSDLSEAVGLLNAASKTGRLRFGVTEGARFDFNRHYSDAVDALRDNDPYAARLSLQRALRCVEGFGQNPFAAKH